MSFVEDAVAWPTMLRLIGCVSTELEKSELPGVCQAAVIPGPGAVMDACAACGKSGSSCTGQAWVRFVAEFPSQDFPAPDVSGGRCNSPMAYILEVGIARCLPTGSTNALNGYKPPSLEELVDATRLQMADKAAMRRAIQCCVKDMDVSYNLGQYTPMTVPGDCGGGTWQVTVWSQ